MLTALPRNCSIVAIWAVLVTVSATSDILCDQVVPGSCTANADSVNLIQKNVELLNVKRQITQQQSSKAVPILPAEDGQAVIRHESLEATWHYDAKRSQLPGEQGRLPPSQWHLGTGSKDCAQVGTQSPIDLPWASAVAAKKGAFPDPLVPVTNGSCTRAEFLINDHTSEVEVELDCNKQFYVDFPAGVGGSKTKRFRLKQFNYHSPSEHTVGGRYFPMEVHHVHVADDGQVLIINVMIAVGEPEGDDKGRAAFLTAIQEKMPPATSSDKSVPGGNKYVWKRDMRVDPYKEFIDLSKGYFYYSGSFTTPPCSPGTQWVIVPNPVVVPQSTLDLYRQIINANPNNQLAPFGDIVGLSPSSVPAFHELAGVPIWNPGLGANVRPIQPLLGKDNEGRKVYNVSATLSFETLKGAAADRRGVVLALSAMVATIWL